MVYHNHFIAVIKSNGKILRERNNNNSENEVYLPFNSEYSIFFKNLNSRDALISVSIDGEDVLNGTEIIVRANSSGFLDGFLRNNRVTNKFKFIQKTQQISDHRGDRIDDGFIRIEYKFVKIKPVTITVNQKVTYESAFHPFGCRCPICNPVVMKHQVYPFIRADNSGVRYGTNHIANPNIYCSTTVDPVVSEYCNNQISSSSVNFSEPQSTEGITVKGSSSDQIFTNSFIDEVEEQSQVIIIRLKGFEKKTNQTVQKPDTVKRKVECSTCGTKNKSYSKFCSTCGTSLF